MNISEVARKTELTAKSIRFYEEKGLISVPSRDSNGYRRYSEIHLNELSVIAMARRVGFTLDESGELLQLAFKSNRTSAEVKTRTMTKLIEVRRKIEELQIIENQLASWLALCPGNEEADCPIIDGLTSGCTHHK